MEAGIDYASAMAMPDREVAAWLESIKVFNTPPEKRAGQKVKVRRPGK